MPRKIICRVCDSERFRKVVVKLPTGALRVTDFDYCLSCKAMFYRPEDRTEIKLSSATSDFQQHVPVNMTTAMISTFPDPNTTEQTEKRVHYNHETLGRLVLRFEIRHRNSPLDSQKHWVLASAERFQQ